MEINVKNTLRFCTVKIAEGSATIDLGLLNDAECEELAQKFLDAAYALGPHPCVPNETSLWFAGLLDKCGIELPEKETGAST